MGIWNKSISCSTYKQKKFSRLGYIIINLTKEIQPIEETNLDLSIDDNNPRDRGQGLLPVSETAIMKIVGTYSATDSESMKNDQKREKIKEENLSSTRLTRSDRYPIAAAAGL